MNSSWQMRMEDGRLYNPSRDYAYNFRFVIQEAAKRLEDERWKEVHQYLEEMGFDQEDLGKACEAYILAMGGACDDPKETLADVFDRTGFADLPEPVKIAFCATLGAILTGCYFSGVREATINDNGFVKPLSSYSEILDAGREAHRVLAMPAWKRRLRRLVKKLVQTLFGTGKVRS